MKIRTRLAKGNDLFIIEGLDKICFMDEAYESKHPHLKKCKWWLATVDGNPIGYCAGLILDNNMFLSRAGVLPSHRGFGVQKKLIDTRLRYASRQGLDSVYTYVAPDNLASLNSLVARGFRFYEPEWKYAGDDFLYLIKSLDK